MLKIKFWVIADYVILIVRHLLQLDTRAIRHKRKHLRENIAYESVI